MTKRQEARSEAEHWKEELGNKKQKANELHKLYGKVMTWSEPFDTCNMAEKKMIVFQIIRQVRVRSDYSMEKLISMSTSSRFSISSNRH